MTLAKGDILELVEKDDNGWWLVKKDGVEGWAPFNYLELIAEAAPAPVPPPPPRKVAPPPTAKPSAAKAPVQSVLADANAKPVSVFPGMSAGNGSTTPWKKNLASSDSPADSPTNSRPNSTIGTKAPPPLAPKPKPAAPPIAAKPGAPKKPPMPTAPRPPAAGAAAPKPAPKPAPAGGIGQMDLAAAVSTFEI